MSEKLPLPTEVNTHHVFYQKALYKKRYEKHFRNTPGLVVPTAVAPHNYLHSVLFEGPPKPTRDEMGDLIDYLDDVHPSQKTDRFWGVEAAQRFTIIKEFDNEEETDRYQETRLHLARQIGILSRKMTGIEFPNAEELYRYGKPA